MVEGRTSRDFLTFRRLIAKRPDLAARLLEILTKSVIDYLLGQIAAGADTVTVFDTWGSIVDQKTYCALALPCLARIVSAIKTSPRPVPITIYSKGDIDRAVILTEAGFDGIGVDWTVEMAKLRTRLGDRPTALQGNLDPALLGRDRGTIFSATH